jgi:iron complex outermembrane receptor protein
MNRVCGILSFAAALSALPLAASQNDQNPSGPAALKNLTLEELANIKVTTPSKQPVGVFKTPAAIYVITGDDIRRSGATSIPEALRLAPGVEVARIDGSKWAIGIRGFGTRLSRSVLVMIDGRIVYTELFAGTYWEAQNVFLEDVDRIEVIRGPGGTIWGPNAVNGVINIITKTTKDTRGTFAQAGIGNEEQGFANFRYGGGKDPGLAYRGYALTFNRSPEYHLDGSSFDDWRAAQTGFRMDWGEQQTDAFTVEGDLYKEEAGERVSATTYTAPYARILDDNANLSGGDLNARWRRNLAGGGDLQLQIYYDRYNRYEPNLAERRGTFGADFIEHLPLPGRQQISWGLSVQASHANNPVGVSGLQFIPYQRTDQLYTAFFQDEIGLLENQSR